MKQVPKEPVSDFPPPNRLGGGNLKQVALGPVSLSTPHQKGFDAWGVDYETGLKANCFRNPPPKILKGLKDIFE